MTLPLVQFKEWKCVLEVGQYGNGRVALSLVDAYDYSPIAKATVNLPDYPLAPNQVHIKNYSENAGIAEALEQAQVVRLIEAFDLPPYGAQVVLAELIHPELQEYQNAQES